MVVFDLGGLTWYDGERGAAPCENRLELGLVRAIDDGLASKPGKRWQACEALFVNPLSPQEDM